MTPRVSLGLPVFNGERFLREALASIAAQTFEDYELVISDNGSTDNTEAICREAAAADPRIHYHRVADNHGASWNFNRVLELATAEYFKWVAHDDVLAPTFLASCVAALDADPSVVLAFTGVVAIDETGARTAIRWRQTRAPQPSVVNRFRSIVTTSDHNPEAIFGVIRRSKLLEGRGMGAYGSADRRILCELALRGRFHEVPDLLFENRDHDDRSVRAHGDIRQRAGWFDPARAGRSGWPTWRLGADYVSALWASPLDARTKMRCLAMVPRYVLHMRRQLADDVVAFATSLPTRLRPRRRGSSPPSG